MSDINKDLPHGIGYKSCFMVVEGSTQKKVAEAFLQGRRMKYTYDAGLEKIKNVGAKEKRLMVTGTYKKQNYVLGDEISVFFYDTEEFLKKCENFSKVYVYMTHRVSEIHGFALVENGQLVRLFCYDENEIQNIGEPLPDEIELGYKLPTNFDEARDEEFTTVNEDVIIELALRQVGINVEKYPYKDVKLGKRFEYSSEMAADPYPDDDREISEEVWNLLEVQRFMDCSSAEERLQIVEELKDTLTHTVLDAFGEIMRQYASYGRLSTRIEEFMCIVKSLGNYDYEKTIMTKEELLKKIDRGIRVFERVTFKHFTLENIKCDTLTFVDCVFLDVKLIDNQIDRLECKECGFIRSEISNKLKNSFVVLNKTDFNYCKIHDLEICGEQKHAEWRRCTFEYCAFGNIKLCTNISIVDSSFWNCKGKQLELDIKQLAEIGFHDCKFEGVKSEADIRKNNLINVEIQNLERADAKIDLYFH